ncbi:MAG TPA: hypothetical protein VGB59_05660, partial [Allosphingosinicella sp.]
MVQTYTRRGGEFRVDSSSIGTTLPDTSVARLASGGFVIAWASWTSGGARFQIFNAAGEKVGGEVLATTFAPWLLGSVTVSGLTDGGFVVSWESNSDAQDSGYGVKAQIFNADGTKSGSQFVLSSTTNQTELHPDIAGLPGGGFIATWLASDGNGFGVKAQIFSATGVRLGAEIAVNTMTANNQYRPAVVVDPASGGFLVTWFDGLNGDHTGYAVRARRFDSSGNPLDQDFPVSSASTAPANPVAALLTGGEFVISWTDTNGYDVKAQVYSAAGQKIGGEFLVTTLTTSEQAQPAVAALPWGGFVIAWHDYAAHADDSSGSVRARIFDAAGAPVGTEFRVSQTTAGEQYFPDVSVLDSGSIVFSWVDKANSAVEASIFNLGPASDLSLSRTALNETRIEGMTLATLSSNVANGSPHYSIVVDSTGGAFSLVGNRLLVADSSKLDHETAPSPTLTLRVTDINGINYDESFELTVSDSRAEVRYAAGPEFLANLTVQDEQTAPSVAAFAGGFVYIWHHGSDIVGRLFSPTGQPVGTEFPVHAPTANYENMGSVASLASGGFVAVWGAFNGDRDIKAQMFGPSGEKIGGVLAVNVNAAGDQETARVTGLPGGGFVVSWTDLNGGENYAGVRARIFDSSGVALGGEIRVNTITNMDQKESYISARPEGGFVVVWTDTSGLSGDSSPSAVKAQLFDPLGNKLGGEILVNTTTAWSQMGPTVSTLAAGGFVVTWTDNNGYGPYSAVKAQVFSSVGNKVGGEITVTPLSADDFSKPHVVALPWGGFAIGWTDRSGIGDDVSGSSARLQIFDALGGRVGDAIQLNEISDRDQASPRLAAGTDGTMAIAWTDYSGDGGGVVSAGVRSRVLTLPEQLTGGGGDDFLVASHGDSVAGGAGRDLLSISFAGADTGVVADFRALASVGSVIIQGATISDIEVVWYLSGSQHDDLLAPIATEGAEGLAGAVYGLGGNDEIFTNAFSGLVDGGGGNDLINARASTGSAPLLGGAGDDRILGGAGGEILSGGPGDDRLSGGSGADTLDGGEGTDTVDSSQETGGGDVQVNLQNAAVFGPSGKVLDARQARDSYGDLDSLSGIENVKTGAGNDSVYGDELANRIETGAGNDFLMGGAGADTLIGGTGDDVYSILAAHGGAYDDTIVELAGEGTDEIRTSVASFDLTYTANVENLTGLATTGQTLTGNDLANVISGGSGNDTLEGGKGDDLLIGGAGDDWMSGGTGNDTFVVDSLGDTVAEAQGIDTVLTSVNSYLLPGNIENVTATFTGSGPAQTLRGNGGNNRVTGSTGNDVLYARGGDDLVLGRDGIDIVNGGPGRDLLIAGGLSATNLIVNGSFETQDGSNSAAAFVQAAGVAANGVVARTTASLHGWQSGTGAGIELNRIGTNIFFNNGGGEVAVDLESGAGENQRLYQDIAGIAAGTELVLSFAAGLPITDPDSPTSSATAGLEVYWNGALVGTVSPNSTAMRQYSFLVKGAETGSGAGGANRLEFREVGSGSDGRGTMLDGVSLNALASDSEDDWLTYDNEVDGGSGSILVNLSGAAAVLDGVLIEAGQARDTNGTFDTVRGFNNAASGHLGNNWILGSEAANFLTGGLGEDVLDGAGGNDFLDGNIGNDRLIGGLGDDIFLVHDSGDVVVELAGEGVDSIRTTVASFSLVGTQVENLSSLYLGTAHSFRGNALNNNLSGNNLNDFLDLRDGGDDKGWGGSGRDGFYFGSALTSADSADGGADRDYATLAGDYWTVPLTLGEGFK